MAPEHTNARFRPLGGGKPQRLAVVAFLLCGLAFAGCASGDDDAAGDTTPSASESTSSGVVTTTPTASTTPTTSVPDATVVRVDVVSGRVRTESARVRVTRGERVRLVVTSDEADELHVHGYDLTADLVPGAPATVEFVANQVGLFEVETHHHHTLLVQLEVR